MKYKNFDEWFITGMLILKDFEDTINGMRKIMRAAWDAAVNNYDENKIIYKKFEKLEQKATIGEQITELLNTLNDAEKIDCACDQIQIATGYRCGCGRGMALRQAGEGLGKYLRKLRKDLK